jgi:uncharacterized membrane protein YgdD (TMEM256/DUF423 family)
MGQIHSNMKKITLTAGFLGAAGVALGAFGAHGLASTLQERNATGTWETAVLYHLIHAVALFAATCSSVEMWHRNRWLVWFWGLGILLFSGSLYALALGGPRWLGPVTPLGGALLIAGWIVVLWSGLRGKAAP